MMHMALLLIRSLGLGAFILAGLIWAKQALANNPGAMAQSCDLAASRAAQITGVPQSVLFAIARVETGRTVAGDFGPWPWTINQAGKGGFFPSKTEAVAHVSRALGAGETSIDIGCFQISYRWHGTEFPTLEAMFDPDENALYAARYLQKLYAKTGGWEGAIGAYHSRREQAAAKYLEKVTALIAEGLPAFQDQTAENTPLPRENRFPLLRDGPGRMPGSLVPARNNTSVTSLLR